MNGDNMTQSSGSKGSLVGSIIVVIILIAGAIYLFSQKAVTPAPQLIPPTPTVTTPPSVIPPQVNQAPVNNDTVASLEADANAAGTDNATLDADLSALDKSSGL